MKKKLLFWSGTIISVTVVVAGIRWWLTRESREESERYERQETQVVVSRLSGTTPTIFSAGRNLQDTVSVSLLDEANVWLPPGRYFLKWASGKAFSFYPIELTHFRCGPDQDGSFLVTLRPPPPIYPPRCLDSVPEFRVIPSGSFLIGDRLNPRERHYVWLTTYFIAPFEVTNAEFRAFLAARDGYSNPVNWTEAGNRWRRSTRSRATALLAPNDPDYTRFGLPDQPVVWVTWYEANAFCKWLSNTIGESRWIYSLPSDAEWEKAARGPDNLDYGLSMSISDAEVSLYNWRKSPLASVTVVGMRESITHYFPNRYGLYHVTGNVLEWTQTVFRPYNRQQPYQDDERNYDTSTGLRTARGGSWYSASTAYLYIPYRDSFQPEHCTQELGFRLVVRMIPSATSP